MFRSLRNLIFQAKNTNGDPSTIPYLLYYLLPENASLVLIRNRTISSSVTINSSKTRKSSSSSSFVVSYLMKACGLSEDKAISASKEIHFKTTSKPDSVLTLLKNYGFTKPYISKLITKSPSYLLCNPMKTLKPKLDFLNSRGLSGLDLANAISRDPLFLVPSLKQIIPSFDFLKNILHTDTNVLIALKRSSALLRSDRDKTLILNIEFLRNQGVPDSNICKFLMSQPRALLINTDRFKEIIEEIKGMGFEPSQTIFHLAIHGLTAMSKLTWERKVSVYRNWGWSEEEIRMAFRKHPQCMMTSEKKIEAIMDFLVNKMGYSSYVMAQWPAVFVYSLEKRIIPRCSVNRILVSKGLIKKQMNLTSLLTMAEKSFLEKFVIKYGQEVPQLLKLYQGGESKKASLAES